MFQQGIADVLSLPSDVNEVQLHFKELQNKFLELQEKYKKSEKENEFLRERLNRFQQQIFGRKTEKYSIDDGFSQRFLFGGQEGNIEGMVGKEIEEEKEIPVLEHKCKKRSREAMSRDLPVVDITHDIPEEEKRCKCGCIKDCIGEETSTEVEVIPAVAWKVCTHRLKYACKKGCEGVEKEEGEPTVQIAALPVKLLPKSIATPSLLSQVFINKFCDSLPYYRQEGIFGRIGLELTRATMCAWTIKVSEKVLPLIELFVKEIVSGFSINIDETTVQVLHEPGRKAETKSFMWVFRGGTPQNPIILYRYSETRRGKVAAEILGDYQGYVQTDGYSGYNILDARQGIKLVGCWAHVRRKFNEVVKAAESNRDIGLARDALRKIRELYRIESESKAKGIAGDAMNIVRQTQSLPLLKEFENWLKENAIKAPPRGLLGKAFKYTLNQWPRLTVYIEDSRLRMDNNLAENAIRPFVVGRKNWLFSDQPEGATASATLYSIIETAKANGLEPYKYLFYLFHRIPLIQSREEWEKLLPQNLTPELLNETYSAYFIGRYPNMTDTPVDN
jgi:transposase